MDAAGILSLIFYIALPIVLIAACVIPIYFFSYKPSRRHMEFEFKGHKIEVFTFLTSAKFLIDSELVDSGKRLGYDYHFDFIKKIDDDTIRIFITKSFASPEIKLYINDEKQNIDY